MSPSTHPTPVPGLLTRDLPPPPGVTLVEGGAEVAVYAGHADGVEVCLFEPGDTAGETERRVPLTERAHGVVVRLRRRAWRPGQRYNLRARATGTPTAACGTTPPSSSSTPTRARSRARCGGVREVYGHVVDATWHGDGELPSDLDSRGHVPRCVVVDDAFDWEDDRPPAAHPQRDRRLRGARAQPDDAPPRRAGGAAGTYAGLAHPASVAHLDSLGVTAVELLPVHAFTQEPFLARRA